MTLQNATRHRLQLKSNQTRNPHMPNTLAKSEQA